MSKIEKILEKWKQGKQPVPKEKVIAVLEKYFRHNYEIKAGSHIVVRHPELKGLPGYGAKGEFSIAIKGGQKVKPIYLKDLVVAIEYLQEMGIISKEEKD
jgi:hypothetical protein